MANTNGIGGLPMSTITPFWKEMLDAGQLKDFGHRRPSSSILRLNNCDTRVHVRNSRNHRRFRSTKGPTKTSSSMCSLRTAGTCQLTSSSAGTMPISTATNSAAGTPIPAGNINSNIRLISKRNTTEPMRSAELLRL